MPRTRIDNVSGTRIELTEEERLGIDDESLTVLERMSPSHDLYDRYKWLDDAACKDLELGDFFIEAGRAISPEIREVCRRCPVRRECVIHAYQLKLIAGYFGGLSPGQRRSMTLQEALNFIERDQPGAAEAAPDS